VHPRGALWALPNVKQPASSAKSQTRRPSVHDRAAREELESLPVVDAFSAPVRNMVQSPKFDPTRLGTMTKSHRIKLLNTYRSKTELVLQVFPR
jgi:hypothetical protein